MKFFTNSYYSKIFKFITMPFITVIISLCIINEYYLNKLENEAINKCQNSLYNMSHNLTNQLHEISNTSAMLESSQSFFDIFFGNNIIPLNHNYKFSHTVSALKEFKLTKNFIDSVIIIDKTNYKIISSDGIVPFNYYFGDTYFGENYNTEEFWLNLKIDNNQMKILPLDIRRHTTDIIPLVFFQIGPNTSINPLIINLDKEKLSEILFQYKISENSNMYVYNISNNEIISSTDDSLLSSINIVDYLNNDSSSELIINGEKMTLISYISKDFYNDTLNYFMIIPQKDIFAMSSTYRYISLLILICCCFIGFSLCYFISLKLYTPIKGLTSLVFSENLVSKESLNEIELLDNNIRLLISNNRNLKNDINTVIPSVCEKYILDILRKDDYDIKELEPLLKRYNFSFPYKYFTTILIKFNFTNDFYNTFFQNEQNIIREQLIKFIKSTSEKEHRKYILTLDKDMFCILLNSNLNDFTFTAKNYMVELKSLLAFDVNYIKLLAGIGRTYKYLEGIHNSWNEANHIFSELSEFSSEQIKIYTDSIDIITGYYLTASDDNHIFNYLLSCNLDKCTSLLKAIIQKNISASISQDSLKDLYIQIYSIGLKVINLKHINISDLMKEKYIDIIRYRNTLSINTIANYIINLYTEICNYDNEINNTGLINIKELKKYIDDNFTKDIYLDALSEKYTVTAKHMSKILKDILGVSFKKYINNLRISKSKELLIETNTRIEDIAINVGFNSRNTFIRAFKIIEGITPSEYRNKHK